MGGGASPGRTTEEPACDEVSEPEQREQFSRPCGTRGARGCGSPAFETLGYSRWSLRDRHAVAERATAPNDGAPSAGPLLRSVRTAIVVAPPAS